MWVVATVRVRPAKHHSHFRISGPRWFWSGPYKIWTRDVGQRTYYESKEKAEAAALLAVALDPELIGLVEVVSVQEMLLEYARGRCGS